jgi:pSer/pThr/pTyr-binding forkhead associated (FHA) protein
MAEQVQTLMVRESSGAEREVAVGAAPITIGRDTVCTIPLASRYISRQHARIEAREGAVLYIDLGSHNGSRVNGRHVDAPTRLRPGDWLDLADVAILCRP